jgi:uncharacterized membrane protein
MAKKDNNHNHELTTISVREQVERVLIEGSVPVPKRQEVAERIEKIVYERSSGPLPDVNIIAGLEQIVPGCGREIMADAIKEMQHRRDVEKRELDLREKEMTFIQGVAQGEFRSVTQSRIIGVIAFLAILLFAGWSFYMGSEKVALLALGAAAISVVGQLIRGGASVFRITSEAKSSEADKAAPDSGAGNSPKNASGAKTR